MISVEIFLCRLVFPGNWNFSFQFLYSDFRICKVKAVDKYQGENWEMAGFHNKCQGNECQLHTDICQDIKRW